MKKAMALLLITLVSLSSNFVNAQPPQDVFRIVFYVHIHSNGDASVQIVATLTEEHLLKGLNELAKKNATAANKKFASMLYDLYSQLLRNVRSKYRGVNFTYDPYNFITISSRWTGAINFVWRHFLVPRNGTWETLFYGPITYVYGGVVYSYSWYRMYLWLPSTAYFLNSIPKPADFEDGILMWKDGDFIPYLSVTYNATLYSKLTGEKVLTLPEFLMKTKKQVALFFIPKTGTLNVSINLTGMKPTPQVEAELLQLLNSSLPVISYSFKHEKSGLFLSLLLRPNVTVKTSILRKTWTVEIKLPFKPDSVELKGGGKVVSYDGTIKIIITERKYWPLAVLPFFVALLLLFWRWRR